MRSLRRKWPFRKRSHPALGIRRWFVVLVIGIVAWSVTLALLLIAIAHRQPLGGLGPTSAFISWPVLALLFAVIGTVCVAVALYHLNLVFRSLVGERSRQDRQYALSTKVAPASELAEVPSIVSLGGGHGLSTLLRGLKVHTTRLTAIVTVADDGGSSGVLRREMGILPPGDLRRCIAALAEVEPLMTQLLQYRFGQGAGLDGHAFGNLFIAAMAGITGDFESAISEASRVLAVRGRILPSSLDNIVLCAEISHPDEPGPHLVQGQSRIAKAGGTIERVFLQPGEAKGYPAAIRALLDADMIVLGPGSLYTSVLPNLLVPDIRYALKASPALKVYVCNVATQPGETDDYTVGDHVRALGEHLGAGFCDYVLANANTDFALPPNSGSIMVQPEFDSVGEYQQEGRLVLEDLVDRALPWRHDSVKLSLALMRLYYTRR